MIRTPRGRSPPTASGLHFELPQADRSTPVSLPSETAVARCRNSPIRPSGGAIERCGSHRNSRREELMPMERPNRFAPPAGSPCWRQDSCSARRGAGARRARSRRASRTRRAARRRRSDSATIRTPTRRRDWPGFTGTRVPATLVPDGRGTPPASGDLIYGTPPPASANLGVPTNNLYGRPGTSGTRGPTSARHRRHPRTRCSRRWPRCHRSWPEDPATAPGSTGSPGGSYP